MGREALARTIFPVGHLKKDEVRAEAERLGLPVASKPDSQEICFAPRGTHAAFVEAQSSAVPIRPGVVVDQDGAEVGRHDGVHRFTIGQRRGLGISSDRALYVTDIDPSSGVVRVGDAAAVGCAGLSASEAEWLGEPPSVGAAVRIKIRSRFEPQSGVITSIAGDRFQVASDRLKAVAPGQAAVVYDGERVLGGGWIESRFAAHPAPDAGEVAV